MTTQELRALATHYNITIYRLGCQWIMISGPKEYRQETRLYWDIRTEREALIAAIGKVEAHAPSEDLKHWG